MCYPLCDECMSFPQVIHYEEFDDGGKSFYDTSSCFRNQCHVDVFIAKDGTETYKKHVCNLQFGCIGCFNQRIAECPSCGADGHFNSAGGTVFDCEC